MRPCQLIGKRVSGRLVQGDTVNAAATGGHRIDIDLHDFTTRIEAGQQLVAVAVGRLVAKLGAITAPLIGR